MSLTELEVRCAAAVLALSHRALTCTPYTQGYKFFVKATLMQVNGYAQCATTYWSPDGRDLSVNEVVLPHTCSWWPRRLRTDNTALHSYDTQPMDALASFWIAP